MSLYTVLTEEQVQTTLETLPGWEVRENRLEKTFTFGSFREAVAFIMRVAFVCEAHNHHPDLSNTYNQVTLSFTTHDAGNVLTQMDAAVVREIEDFSWV